MFNCISFRLLALFPFYVSLTLYSSHLFSQDTIEESLWQSEEWRALMHYHLEKGQWRSLADDKNFFFSPQGDKNPEAELRAAIIAFQTPVTEDDLHPQCKFPARFFWLKAHFTVIESHVPEPKCEKFSTWVKSMKPNGLTVIFPASYINSPSSMFGHSFIRIDEEGQNDQTRLLSYSVSYAAEVPDDNNGAGFIWKGIFGGYPGFLNGAAYYDKVIEYNDLESRDIWEYELNVKQEEVDQFLRHAWEMQHINFNYYFFKENCSFRLLEMLEVAIPNLQLSDKFSTHAIPVDTIRVLEKNGLIKNKVYRPSVLSELHFSKKQLNKTQQKKALEIARGELEAKELKNNYSLAESAAILDFSYDYLRYRAQKDKDQQESVKNKYKNRSLAILSSRSKLPKIEEKIIDAPISPENGHNSKRVGLFYGEQDNNSFVSLKWRPAFHDLLDSDIGFINGAQIEFLSFDGHFFYEDNTVQMNYLRLVNVIALSPRNMFAKPISWSFDMGWRDIPYLNKATSRFVTETGGGFTRLFGEKISFSLLAKVNLNTKESLLTDYQLGLGLESIMITKLPKDSKLLLKIATWEYEGLNLSDGQRYQVEYNLPIINRDQSLRVTFEREDRRLARINMATVGWNYYYQ
jgi:hypothetical protein